MTGIRGSDADRDTRNTDGSNSASAELILNHV